MRDKGFDQLATSALQGFSAAEMGGIGLDEVRIEIVLADQEAELVAEPDRIDIQSIRTVRII